MKYLLLFIFSLTISISAKGVPQTGTAAQVKSASESSVKKESDSDLKKSKVNSPAELSSILPPIYSADFFENLNEVHVKALVDISKTGQVTRIAQLKVSPQNIPHDEIVKSIFLAKFSPQINQQKIVDTFNFEFEWQFQIQRMPQMKFELEIE